MKAKGYSYYSPVLEPVNEEERENDRGKSQVWRNSTTTITASSVAFPQIVCVCVCVSERAPDRVRERERK